jgi:hypothetical protein
MKITIFKSVAILVTLTAATTVNAATFAPKFSDYPFPGTQYTVDAAANTFFNSAYGINVSNAYLYKDSRDTFDGIGITNGTVANIGSSTNTTGRIDFLDTTDFVTIDYWAIQPSLYKVFASDGTELGSLSAAGDSTNRTHTFHGSASKEISYLTFSSLRPHPPENIPKLRILRGGEVDAHQRARLTLGVEQRTGGQQVALVQHALGQRRCPPRSPPSQTAPPGARQRCSPAPAPICTLRARAWSSRVRMRSAWRRSWPWSMHQASAFSSRAGVVRVASSLVSSRRSTSAGRCRQKAHPPAGRQDLGKTTDVDGALQAVERTQARGVFGRDVAVGVVLHDVKLWALASCSTRWALPGDRL